MGPDDGLALNLSRQAPFERLPLTQVCNRGQSIRHFCEVLEGGTPEVAERIVDDLVELVGEDHDRVVKGRENIAKVMANLK
jgi:hypothetical protein